MADELGLVGLVGVAADHVEDGVEHLDVQLLQLSGSRRRFVYAASSANNVDAILQLCILQLCSFAALAIFETWFLSPKSR